MRSAKSGSRGAGRLKRFQHRLPPLRWLPRFRGACRAKRGFARPCTAPLFAEPTSAVTPNNREERQHGEARPKAAGPVLQEAEDRGSRNPPRPPAAPTIPVRIPTESGKRCGRSWNTEPFPIPSNPIPTARKPSANPAGGSVATPARQSRRAGQQSQEQTISANPIRQSAAYGAKETAEQNHECREIAGLNFRESVLIVEEDR